MSSAQAEVTWLAYNYDVVRYTAQANRVVVEYGEWFKDPVATANRIRDTLNLPGLTSERERLESLRHIVKERYRHRREGSGNALVKMALAENFYRDIAASARDRSVHLLERYGPTLDLVFGALGPFVELLAELPTIRTQLREATKSLATMVGVSADRDALRELVDQQASELHRSAERIKGLESALDAVKR